MKTRQPVALDLPHPSPVYALAASPDDRFVAVGGRDRFIRVWAMPEAGTERMRFLHTDPGDAHWSTNSETLLLRAYQHDRLTLIRIADLSVTTHPIPSKGAAGAWGDDWIIASDTDSVTWATKSLDRRGVVRLPPGTENVTVKAGRLFLRSSAGVVSEFRREGTHLRQVQRLGEGTTFCVSPRYRYVSFLGADQVATVSRVGGSEVIATRTLPGAVRDHSICDDGSWLAARTSSEFVVVWNLATNRIGKVHDPLGAIRASPWPERSDLMLVSNADEKHVSFSDPATRQPIGPVLSPWGAPASNWRAPGDRRRDKYGFSPDGRHLFVGYVDGTIVLWRLERIGFDNTPIDAEREVLRTSLVAMSRVRDDGTEQPLTIEEWRRLRKRYAQD